MEHYLLIDLGTGSTRAALADSRGRILDMRSFVNRYYRDSAYPDAQFFLPEEWKQEILRCCQGLHAEHPEIRVRAVSASGARQSLVLLDENGRAFYGLPNIDNRGREYMSEIGDHARQARIYEHSGKWVTEDFCAAKLMGLRKKRPELYGKISTVLSLSEWIGWIFTGEAYFEPSQACETQLYDLETGQWSEELCRYYGVAAECLPELRNAGESAGEIFPDLREELGMTDDAFFVIGGADTQCAMLQTGMLPGDVAVVSGTTSPCVALVDHRYHDVRQRVWTDANLGAKGFLIEMNPGVTGLNYQRMKDSLCPDISYAELERAYAEKKDFSCTASFSSLLFYERRSLRHGGFFMTSPYAGNTDRIDLMWAVVGDTACATFEQLRRLRELSGHSRKYILACGGGFRSGTLCQMIADLTGLELRLQTGYEQATLQGLIRICNEAVREDSVSPDVGVPIVYRPGDGELIGRYYPLWSRNRLEANRV